MKLDRSARRCALQVMYQFDAGSDESDDSVRGSLNDSPADDRARAAGYELAQGAWEGRSDSDEAVERLAPEWPVRRQPMVDRNLLRLAYHEMHSKNPPPKVAINEAVELAKEFGGERSPGFVNAVLDKVMRGETEE